jgi:hypothetical protein
MMPVILAAFSEGFRIGIVGCRVKHPSARPISRHAFSLEISQVSRERCRTKRLATMPNDSSHDDDASSSDRDDIDSAARRPRPNVERRCVRPLRPKLLPV